MLGTLLWIFHFYTFTFCVLHLMAYAAFGPLRALSVLALIDLLSTWPKNVWRSCGWVRCCWLHRAGRWDCCCGVCAHLSSCCLAASWFFLQVHRFHRRPCTQVLSSALRILFRRPHLSRRSAPLLLRCSRTPAHHAGAPSDLISLTLATGAQLHALGFCAFLPLLSSCFHPAKFSSVFFHGVFLQGSASGGLALSFFSDNLRGRKRA